MKVQIAEKDQSLWFSSFRLKTMNSKISVEVNAKFFMTWMKTDMI